LKTRVLTGMIAGAGFLLVVWAGGVWYTALIFFMATIAYYEMIKMNRMKIADWPEIAGLFFLWLILLPGVIWQGYYLRGDILYAFVLLFLFITVASKNRFEYQQVAYLLFSSVYIGIAFHYMNETRMVNGLWMTLAILFTTWATDTGAYFGGKFLGRRKLWPSISPNKTIEGSLSGIILAVVIMVIVSTTVHLVPVSKAVIMGLVISISGQIGDLMESAVKRTLDVKDSGNILPGHGGILDRFDSLLVVFPVLHLMHLL
jgi:phosphatidate cytidylyltransferase